MGVLLAQRGRGGEVQLLRLRPLHETTVAPVLEKEGRPSKREEREQTRLLEWVTEGAGVTAPSDSPQVLLRWRVHWQVPCRRRPQRHTAAFLHLDVKEASY